MQSELSVAGNYTHSTAGLKRVVTQSGRLVKAIC